MPKLKSNEVNESCSSEEEWEEVEENQHLNIHAKPNVEIELNLPDKLQKQRSKKEENVRQWLTIFIKRAINKTKKNIQVAMHKTHLLCLLASGFRLNAICNDDELRGLILSCLPTQFIKLLSFNLTKEKLTSLVVWTKENFSLEDDTGKSNIGFHDSHVKQCDLKKMIENFSAKQKIDLVLIQLLIFRSLGLNSRLVMSLQPIPLKPMTEKQREERTKRTLEALQKAKAKTNKWESKPQEADLMINTTIPQLDGANDEVKVVRRTSRRKSSPPKLPEQGTQQRKTKKTAKSCKKINSRSKATESKVEPHVKTNKNLSKTTEKKKLVTASKYAFSGDENVLFSGDDLPTAMKINKMAASAKKPSLKRKSAVVGSNAPGDGMQKSVVKKSTEQKLGQRIIFSSSTGDSDDDLIPNKKQNQTQQPVVTSDMKSVSTQSNKTKNTIESKTNLRKRVKKINYAKKGSDASSDEDAAPPSDEDFVDEGPKTKFRKKRSSLVPPTKPGKRKRSLSKRSSAQDARSSNSVNQWIEVFVRKVGWICIDCISGTTEDPKLIETNASKPVHYVVTYDDKNCVKDVTARYASNWLITTRKLRVGSVDQNWWKATLLPYKTKNKKQDEEENKMMETNLLSQPMPTSIAAFKNHPLFVLRRHLLKYEAIYPPDVPAIGFVRGEEVLPRSSVHVMHTREKWLQEALSVKDGEEPFKMVASYLLNKKLNRDSDALSLALFGRWQTETYKPPIAQDGKVPRNEYGNVDLFKPCMLPIGCVQMKLAGLNVVARKLNIDIATAIVGFDTHNGFPHPVTDGYIVCKEHTYILATAWEEDQAHAAQRAQEKVDKRVYSRWKLFIRGVLALEKVRNKYKDESNSDHSPINAKLSNGMAWQAEKLQAAKRQTKTRSTGRRSAKKRDDYFPFEVETL